MAGWTAEDVARYRQQLNVDNTESNNTGWTAEDVEKYRAQLAAAQQTSEPVSVSNAPTSFAESLNMVTSREREPEAPTNITPSLPMYATEPSVINPLPKTLSTGMYDTPQLDNSYFDSSQTQQQGKTTGMSGDTNTSTAGMLANTPKAALSALLEFPANAISGIGDIFTNLPRTLGTAGANLFSKAVGSGVEISPEIKETGVEWLPEKAREITSPIRESMVELEGLARVPQDVAESVVAMGGAYATGNIMGLIPNVYGQSLYEAQQQTDDPTKAREYALLTTAMEVGTELIPFEELSALARGGSDNVFKTITRQLLSELWGENLTTTVEPYIARATIDPTATNVTWEDIMQTSLTTIVQTVLMAGAGTGIASVREAAKNPTQENVNKVIDDLESETGANLTEIRRKVDLEFAQQVAEAKLIPDLPNLQAPTITPDMVNQAEPLAPTIGDRIGNIDIDFAPELPTVINQGDLIRTDDGKTAIYQDESYGYTTATDTTTGAEIVLKEGTYEKVDMIEPMQADTEMMLGQDLELPDINTNIPTLDQLTTQEKISPNQAIQTVSPTTDITNQLQAKTSQIAPNTADLTVYTPQEQITQLVEQATPTNMVETFNKIDTIMKANPNLMKMNLQMFAELKQDLTAMKDLGLINDEVLKKHNKAFSELETKGITKATRKAFVDLVNIKNSIKDIKIQHKAEIAEIKASNKVKIASRKLTKTVNRVKKNFNKLNQGGLFDEAQEAFNKVFADSDLASVNFTDVASIRTLTDEKLNQIDSALKQVKHIQATINKSFGNTKKETISERRKEVINNINRVSKGTKSTVNDRTGKTEHKKTYLKSAESNLATPKAISEQYSGGKNEIYNTIFMPLRDAENVEFKTDQEAREFLPADYKDMILTKEWNEPQTIGTSEGDIKITSGEKVMLKLAFRDPYVKDSLLERGFKRKKEKNPTILLESDYSNIKLNETEQRMYDSVDGFFEYLYKKMDVEHYIRNGQHLAKYEFYFPKSVSPDELGVKIGEVKDGEAQIGSLNNSGITQKRTGSKNTIIMDDVANVLENHLAVSSKYIAYVNVVEDIRRILFAKDALNVRESLRSAFGVQKNGMSIFENRIKSVLEDLQGISNYNPNMVQRGLRYVRSKAIKTILGARLTTPLVQIASYPLAYGTLSAKAMAYGTTKDMTPKQVKATMAEAVEYNARVYKRVETGHDRDLASRTNKGFSETMLKGIKAADHLTIAKLWEATKFEVAQTTDPNSDGYMEKVSELFDDVLDSQPNYTTLERSEIMRSKDELTKAVTLFGSAKSAAYNELRSAIVSGDKTLIAQKASGYMTSVIYMTLVRIAIGAVMGKDKDPEEYLIQTLTNSMPIIDNANSMFNGYDISPLGLDVIMDSFNSLANITGNVQDVITGDFDKDNAIKDLQEAVYDASMWFGIPVENIVDDLGIIMNRIPGLKDIYPKELQKDIFEDLELPSFSELELPELDKLA